MSGRLLTANRCCIGRAAIGSIAEKDHRVRFEAYGNQNALPPMPGGAIMAGKKRKAIKTRPKPPREKPAALPDRRAMEAGLREVLAGLGGQVPQPISPAAKAQAVLDRAFREMNPGPRRKLAEEALAIDPDCADAYVLLAEVADSRRAATRTLCERCRRRRAIAGAGDISARCRPLLGHPRHAPVHACSVWPGEFPVDGRLPRRSDRALARHAPPESERQSGDSLRTRRLFTKGRPE